MSLLDCILNLAGLLLWLNWVAPRLDSVVRVSAASLAGTLTRAEDFRPRRDRFFLSLVLLVVGRGFLYWRIGPNVDWTAHLQMGLVAISFRSDFLLRMLCYSGLSFLLTLATFYLWLLFLSALNTSVPEKDSVQKLVRVHLGWLERLPLAVKWLVPFVVVALAWLALQPLFSWMGLIPRLQAREQLFEQAAVIGLGSYLVWKYLIVGILVLHVLNTYVYLGNNPFWMFLNTTARRIMGPLDWLPLRVGKVDFAPLLVVAAIFLLTEFAIPRAFALLYGQLAL